MSQFALEALSLLEQHGGKLFALLSRIVLRSDVAEELLQELFCKLAGSAGFAQASDRYAFAVRAAVNLAYNYRRGQRRLSPDELDLDELAGPDASPLVALVRREELDGLLDAIGRLPAESRDLIAWRYLERQDFETIATRIGKSSHQARGQAQKALGRLKKILGASNLAKRPRSEP